MNKYTIKELDDKSCTYLELRILMYIECEKKMNIITDVLNFLNYNSFFTNLTTFYYINDENQIRSENFPERQGVSSLSMDLRDDKIRFKFWDGSKIFWAYHREDLYACMLEGREEFMSLSDKCAPVTDAIFTIKNKFDRDILHVSYKYYPDNTDLDILYHVKFSEYIKEHKMENRMLEDINNEISLLGEDVLNNIKFRIDYSFDEHHCSPCEEARKKREAEQNKENNK